MGSPDRAPRGNREPGGPPRALAILRTLTLFGFAQLEFGGTLALADGRYVVRGEDGDDVLVVRTLSAPAPRRRRRRSRPADAEAEPAPLPLARVTFVRASIPFGGEAEAGAWLERTLGSEDSIDDAISAAARALNAALHAHAAANGTALPQTVSPERAALARVGFGSGEEVADGAFTRAHELDPRGRASRRGQRTEELRPQERVAAVLGGRERLDACETLLLRARADLDAGRDREAALQLRIGLEALLVELAGALDDPGHSKDMAALRERRGRSVEAAEAAVAGDLGSRQLTEVRELLDLCERVLRRRRVLRG